MRSTYCDPVGTLCVCGYPVRVEEGEPGPPSGQDSATEQPGQDATDAAPPQRGRAWRRGRQPRQAAVEPGAAKDDGIALLYFANTSYLGAKALAYIL